MIHLLRILLFPLSLIYGVIMWMRNRLYDYNFIPSTSFRFPVVVIGNLAVGGTGKSPMAEYILRLITPTKSISLLSRGYGRKTKGYREVNTTDTAELAGDEPLQIKRKFPNTPVFVCEDRVFALKKLTDCNNGVLLDDAYQHRALQPSFTVLLFDFNSLCYPILPLPTGNFRDTLKESNRASVIVITKCPKEIDSDIRFQLESKLRKHSRAPIFFARISYGSFVNDLGEKIAFEPFKKQNILLFTGIAKPEPLVAYLEPQVSQLTHIRFKDHHAFNSTDLARVATAYEQMDNNNKLILTTEKDFQRLPKSFIDSYPIYIIPIQQVRQKHA